MKTWYKIHKHPESLPATKKQKTAVVQRFSLIRGPAWGFVDLRGDSWTFVGLRGLSWTFVGLRGLSWRFVGDSWRFVGFKHCQACVVYNIRAESWQFVLGSGGTARNRGEMQGPTTVNHTPLFKCFGQPKAKTGKVVDQSNSCDTFVFHPWSGILKTKTFCEITLL